MTGTAPCVSHPIIAADTDKCGCCDLRFCALPLTLRWMCAVKRSRQDGASMSAASETTRKRTASTEPQPSQAEQVASQAAAQSADLNSSIKALHLYCPGRLLHLRRTSSTDNAPACTAPTTEELVMAEVRAEAARQQCASSTSEAARNSCSAAASQHARFVLIDGQPDARFEFIAVRSTWISDHYLASMLCALDAAQGLPSYE